MEATDYRQSGSWPRFQVSRLWTLLVAFAAVGTLISVFVFDPRTVRWWIVDDSLDRFVALVVTATALWSIPVLVAFGRVALLRVNSFGDLAEQLDKLQQQIQALDQVHMVLMGVMLDSRTLVELDIVEVVDADTIIVQTPSGLIRGPVRMGIADTILLIDLMEREIVGHFAVTQQVRHPNLYGAQLVASLNDETLKWLFSSHSRRGSPIHRVLAIGIR